MNTSVFYTFSNMPNNQSTEDNLRNIEPYKYLCGEIVSNGGIMPYAIILLYDCTGKVVDAYRIDPELDYLIDNPYRRRLIRIEYIKLKTVQGKVWWGTLPLSSYTQVVTIDAERLYINKYADIPTRRYSGEIVYDGLVYKESKRVRALSDFSNYDYQNGIDYSYIDKEFGPVSLIKEYNDLNTSIYLIQCIENILCYKHYGLKDIWFVEFSPKKKGTGQPFIAYDYTDKQREYVRELYFKSLQYLDEEDVFDIEKPDNQWEIEKFIEIPKKFTIKLCYGDDTFRTYGRDEIQLFETEDGLPVSRVYLHESSNEVYDYIHNNPSWKSELTQDGIHFVELKNKHTGDLIYRAVFKKILDKSRLQFLHSDEYARPRHEEYIKSMEAWERYQNYDSQMDDCQDYDPYASCGGDYEDAFEDDPGASWR